MMSKIDYAGNNCGNVTHDGAHVRRGDDWPDVTLGDLVDLVETCEDDRAPGSETCLLGAFVAAYDTIGKIRDMRYDEPVAPEIYAAWEAAYQKYDQYISAGRTDFVAGDLF
jgi:hypothetical protein